MWQPAELTMFQITCFCWTNNLSLADGTPLIKNKKGEHVPDLHAQAIAKKAVAACKKNSAQAQLNQVESSVEKPSAAKPAGAMTAEIKPKESAGDFYSRILKD